MSFSLFNKGDLIDLSQKARNSGWAFILSKLVPGMGKVARHWSEKTLPPVNWWVIPKVRDRWREKITGNPNLEYHEYVAGKYLQSKIGLSMLSIGCGTGSQELNWSGLQQISSIDAFDISPNNIQQAVSNAIAKEDSKINFFVADFYKRQFTKQYDVILFHSSLHHFNPVKKALLKAKELLKVDGILVIHEYCGPNRLQYSSTQLKATNQLLQSIPEQYRTYYESKKVKHKAYRPGWLRMILTDPSEAPDSENIIPEINSLFKVLEMKSYGGNLLQPLFKGIAHHFVSGEGSKAFLDALLPAEDLFCKVMNSTDFVFVVAKAKGNFVAD